MSKMTRQQLNHLRLRLDAKIEDKKRGHPTFAKIEKVTERIQTLGLLDRTSEGQAPRLKIINGMSKAELKQLAVDQVKLGHQHGSTLIGSLAASVAGQAANAKLNALKAEKRALDRDIKGSVTAWQNKSQEVYDTVIFSGSSAEALSAIKGFMNS